MSLTATLSQGFGDAFATQGLDRSYGLVVVSARPDLALGSKGVVPGSFLPVGGAITMEILVLWGWGALGNVF